MQRREIAWVVGIGAVKYADLLPNRQSDYVFSWDKMLALQGNTAPYSQYAYARTRSVLQNASEDGGAVSSSETKVLLVAPHELALAKHLLRFGIVLDTAFDDYRPNFICNYGYELAAVFAGFWA